MDFKIRLEAARVNAGLTQIQAADAIGVSKSTLVYWEKGYTLIPAVALKKLCDIYQMPMECIILPSETTKRGVNNKRQ